MQRLTLGNRLVLVAAFLFGGIFMHDDPAHGQARQVAEYDRPAKMPHQSRSAVIAKHGIVARASRWRRRSDSTFSKRAERRPTRPSPPTPCWAWSSR